MAKQRSRELDEECFERGAMVVLSLEEYASLTDSIEMKLDEADRQAAMTEERLSHETVFSNVRSAVHGK